MTKKQFLLALLVLLSLTCTAAATAQRAQTQPRDAEQRRRDEETVRNMRDPGFDLAVVVTPSSIQAEPKAASRVLRRVERNEFLSLVNRTPNGLWYRVVEVESATEGWIHGRDVVIKLTANTSAGPAMEEEHVGTAADPEVSVTNAEPSTDLNLRIGEQLYVIPANSTRVLTLKPGKLRYYGYSPGIRPAFGSREFRSGYRYTWSFRIVNR